MKKFLFMVALGLMISACGNNNCPTTGVNNSNPSCPGYVAPAPAPNSPYGNYNNGGSYYNGYPQQGYPQGYPQQGYPQQGYPYGYATGGYYGYPR